MYDNAYLRLLTLLICVVTLVSLAEAQVLERPPQLLLTAQRLKRLKRDRERQTPRWLNFEQRIKNVPDSPERGFELALYYTVTGEEERGKEAVIWAKTHRTDCRQTALILDWCRNLLSDEEAKMLGACQVRSASPAPQFTVERDKLFIATALGSASIFADSQYWGRHLDWLVREGFGDSNELYAAIETISALRTTQRLDLRENAQRFFKSLPVQFLLNLKPEQTEHPDWKTHVAALALVSLDPNNDSSQFLQGWAIEDRQMIHEGPGVAYELLWADPYLPGVGYQNLDPWWFDEEQDILLARSNWQANACWVRISSKGAEQQNCPATWQTQGLGFGHLQLVPVIQNCVETARSAPNNTVVFWKLKPNGRVKYAEGGKGSVANATAAGLLRMPSNAEGKVCVIR